MNRLFSDAEVSDALKRVGPLMSYGLKGVVFFDNFSSGLGKWQYAAAGVTLQEISGNKFARLSAGYPGDPAIMMTNINVTPNTNYTITFKINGAGGLYINKGSLYQVGSGRYDGTLSGFKVHTQNFNSGNASSVEIMFMAYGHDFAVDDVELKD